MNDEVKALKFAKNIAFWQEDQIYVMVAKVWSKTS